MYFILMHGHRPGGGRREDTRDHGLLVVQHAAEGKTSSRAYHLFDSTMVGTHYVRDKNIFCDSWLIGSDWLTVIGYQGVFYSSRTQVHSSDPQP